MPPSRKPKVGKKTSFAKNFTAGLDWFCLGLVTAERSPPLMLRIRTKAHCLIIAHGSNICLLLRCMVSITKMHDSAFSFLPDPRAAGFLRRLLLCFTSSKEVLLSLSLQDHSGSISREVRCKAHGGSRESPPRYRIGKGMEDVSSHN